MDKPQKREKPIPKILLFGGTTEGKKAAAFLESHRIPYIYSTREWIDFNPGPHSYYRHGVLNEKEMTDLCREQNIDKIIDAAHPFAEQLHYSIGRVAIHLNITAYRFERAVSPMKEHPSVHCFPDYQSTIEWLLNKSISPLLALTGVRSIPRLKTYWQNYHTWFRILPRSYEEALKHQLSPKHLILQKPQTSLDTEQSLIKQLQPAAILVKDSGPNGFTDIKIEAALSLNTRPLVINRPPLPSCFKTINDLEEIWQQ